MVEYSLLKNSAHLQFQGWYQPIFYLEDLQPQSNSILSALKAYIWNTSQAQEFESTS
jgi:hypothetical protein